MTSFVISVRKNELYSFVRNVMEIFFARTASRSFTTNLESLMSQQKSLDLKKKNNTEARSQATKFNSSDSPISLNE